MIAETLGDALMIAAQQAVLANVKALFNDPNQEGFLNVHVQCLL